MFSMDALIVSLLPIIGKFLMANKFTIMAIFYALDKLAKYTDTTFDDSIITLLKNTFLRIIGRGDIVDLKFDYFKDHGLINKIEPLDLKKASVAFDEKIKTGQITTVEVDKAKPQILKETSTTLDEKMIIADQIANIEKREAEKMKQ